MPNKRTIDIAITLAFLGFLFVSMALTFDGRDAGTIAKEEFRKVADWPNLPNKLSDLSSFTQQLEKAMADRFGFRQSLLAVFTATKREIGDSSAASVRLGRDGWLFLDGKDYSDPIGDSLAWNVYSAAELAETKEVFRRRGRWFEERGMKYVFMIAPEKSSIYPEFLPEYFRSASEESAQAQLVGALREAKDVRVVDAKRVLLANKALAQLYMKFDTHWNTFGAALVGHELVTAVYTAFALPDVPDPVRLENFQMLEVRGGDLARMINVAREVSEVQPLRPDWDEASCAKKLATSLDGGRPDFSTECKGRPLRVLVFRDSFFEKLHPYLSRHFGRVRYVWERMTFDAVKRELELGAYDVVIEEFAERQMPVRLKAKDDFALVQAGI